MRDLIQVESLPDDIRGWPISTALKQSAIIAPAMFAEPSRFGIVRALGNGLLSNGKRYTFSVKVGDLILCTRYPRTGAGAQWQGQRLFFMSETEVLAIVKENANGC